MPKLLLLLRSPQRSLSFLARYFQCNNSSSKNLFGSQYLGSSYFESIGQQQRNLSSEPIKPVQRIIGAVEPKKIKPKEKPNIKVTFICDNEKRRIESFGHEGDTLLDVVVDNELDIDGFGACEGTLACSSCHLIFKKEDFDRLPNQPDEDENDMLDMAYGLCETSRLGCQIHLTKHMDNVEVIVPDGMNDARS